MQQQVVTRRGATHSPAPPRRCRGPPHAAGTRYHHHQNHHKRCQRFLQLPSATPDESSEFEGVEGNEVVQEALMQQLRVQIETQSLKEEIKEDLKGKVEEMKQLGEELINQLDAELGIEKFRAELESTQVLSDANDKFNELEEQLQQIKDQIKADQADLQAFEAASAAARSQGLFFKNLYQPELDDEGNEQPGGGGSSSSSSASSSSSSSRSRVPLDPAAARKAAAVVASSAEEEVSSPFRMYLFGAMAAVLALVVAQDLSTDAPSLGLDGLYAVLGLLLGVNAYNERTALLKLLEQRQAQAIEDVMDTSSTNNK